jgi:hypothetical protein
VERKNNDTLQKSDLETIIKVNNKSIELHTEISEQYETIIEATETIVKAVNESQCNKSDIQEIKAEIKEINKTQFKIWILLTSGIASLIIQIISLFLVKH